MTIDEAIAHAREKAEEIRENIIDGNNLEPYESYCIAMTERCAEEHEQLAEWLEELKTLKSEPIDCGSDLGKSYYYNLGRENGYNKAIDVACEYLKCEWAVDNLQTCDDFDKIAERLKAGEQNERSVSEDYRENK